MTLSDAIRLGAMTGAQCFAGFRGPDGSTCAMGAAYAAVGIRQASSENTEAIDAQWGAFRLSGVCPVCGIEGLLKDRVMHLNDIHMWTRERIADWVQTVEATPEPVVLVEAGGSTTH